MISGGISSQTDDTNEIADHSQVRACLQVLHSSDVARSGENLAYRRRPAVLSLRAIRCAIEALWVEVLQFQFRYPQWDVVPEAATKGSLHYHIYSDSLSWDAMRLDAAGIPATWYRVTGTTYWPAYIAWYGLVRLGDYLRRGDQTSLEIFLKQIRWLEEHAVFRDDGAVVWPMDFDYPFGATVLKAPWVSAHAQGLVISALVRAWRLTRRPQILALLAGSTRIFELDVAENGIRVAADDGVLYTEVPGVPPPGIQDGFMTSLLGLHDLWVETSDAATERLFRDGIKGLISTLPQWDYRGKWSWYGGREYLSPPCYHCLNRILLDILGRLSGERCLVESAARWNPDRLSIWDRAEIYLRFLVTKNASRIRYRTWQQ